MNPNQSEAPAWSAPGPLDNKAILRDRSSKISNHPQVLQARCAMIRESLADDLDRIAMFAETGLIAIDGEDDTTLVRMADQMFKVCLSAAVSIGELLAALDGGSS